MEIEYDGPTELLGHTVSIVSAYVRNNPIAATDLPPVIATVREALDQMGKGKVEPAPLEKLVPAVPIKKSVTGEFITCLEDGRRFKSLKRHLRSTFGMTPDEYRAKWGLPRDYPMVAPGYSARRSALAMNFGLGRKPGQVSEPEARATSPRSRKAKTGASA